jgi:tRNA 2-thiouridine synthesizing protein C
MTTLTAKTIIIVQQAPSPSLEALDIGLVFSSFEQDMAMLFIGDGIFFALKNQFSKIPKGKSASKVLSAFPMYGCHKIFVHKKDVVYYNIPKPMLLEHCTVLSSEQCTTLIRDSHHVVSI